MAKQEIALGNSVVNKDSKAYFIAEIGINHNGDLQIAKRLMDAAFAIGWDCVKFQKRVPDIAVPESQKNISRDTPWGRMTYLEYKKRIEFDKADYDTINRYCADKPITWTASPWDIPSMEFILQYDVPFIKLASAVNRDKTLIKRAGETGKPIILSTGMCTQEELDQTVSWLEDYSQGNYILLHTNSTYPTPPDMVNLRYIETLQERYHCIVGYSGHEQNLEPTVMAVAMGAKVIERHVTIDHDMWGTDQKASLEISAMDMLYKRCRNISVALGNGVKIFDNEEQKVRMKLRGN